MILRKILANICMLIASFILVVCVFSIIAFRYDFAGFFKTVTIPIIISGILYYLYYKLDPSYNKKKTSR